MTEKRTYKRYPKEFKEEAVAFGSRARIHSHRSS